MHLSSWAESNLPVSHNYSTYHTYLDSILEQMLSDSQPNPLSSTCNQSNLAFELHISGTTLSGFRGHINIMYLAASGSAHVLIKHRVRVQINHKSLSHAHAQMYISAYSN